MNPDVIPYDSVLRTILVIDCTSLDRIIGRDMTGAVVVQFTLAGVEQFIAAANWSITVTGNWDRMVDQQVVIPADCTLTIRANRPC